MPLGSHEAHELNELLLSCTNSIQNMALFLSQAKDPELKDMIARHYAVHVQDYNMKVEFANQSFSQDTLNVPALQMSTGISMSTSQYPPLEPKVQLQQLDDRAIATSYLLTLKRAGREYAYSAFECSTPQLRTFLEDAFRMCSHQAFEVWQYMARKGEYPVIMASNEAINAMQQIYQSVPEQQPGKLYN
ncbi:Spore coat protein CotF [Paenibacillus sophorae]|uniref:Spore coat protein n=1 Tax=Paenibacillus sophorae TaxID=1333845 RepID=A0A1H8G0P5_9BACL|nr:spore coat protein [Paenibacillus sophorae]QWU14042.1 spore coat protein [Paenibacillus sophorae]SEN37340.1 Spore coat protein CotF [Paenibacillus sophorae]